MLYCICNSKGRDNVLFSCYINKDGCFVPGGQWDEGIDKGKEAHMRMFTKHVNYEDLHVFEAISMVAVAALAIVNGVVFATSLGIA